MANFSDIYHPAIDHDDSGAFPSLTPDHHETIMYGRRLCDTATATIWNDLPIKLRFTNSLSTFKSQLKAHLFKSQYFLISYLVISYVIFYPFYISIQIVLYVIYSKRVRFTQTIFIYISPNFKTYSHRLNYLFFMLCNVNAFHFFVKI